MTDLTEQWKKGELKAGYYYVKNEFGNIFPSDYSEEYDSINDCGVIGFWNEVSEITEVIDKVPTYQEYQALLSDQLAKNEGVEINAELKADNKRLRKEIKEWQKMARRILPALIPVQEDMATLIKTLLKVSPEHKAWLEKNYKEYL